MPGGMRVILNRPSASVTPDPTSAPSGAESTTRAALIGASDSRSVTTPRMCALSPLVPASARSWAPSGAARRTRTRAEGSQGPQRV